MKAKVKSTGEIVDVKPDMNIQLADENRFNDIYSDNNGKIYTEDELDFRSLYPDWQQIKIQASIAAMQGILSNNARDETIENMVNLSIELADTLVEKIKKKLIKSE